MQPPSFWRKMKNETTYFISTSTDNLILYLYSKHYQSDITPEAKSFITSSCVVLFFFFVFFFFCTGDRIQGFCTGLHPHPFLFVCFFLMFYFSVSLIHQVARLSLDLQSSCLSLPQSWDCTQAPPQSRSPAEHTVPSVS